MFSGAMATAGDRMNFIDRFKNILDVMLGQMFFNNVFESETKAFREKFGTTFKGYEVRILFASFGFNIMPVTPL